MKQIEKDKLCYYCLGCLQLVEKDEFEGVRRCENFIQGYRNWQNEYNKALKNET